MPVLISGGMLYPGHRGGEGLGRRETEGKGILTVGHGPTQAGPSPKECDMSTGHLCLGAN
jgi:hypothetical protein